MASDTATIRVTRRTRDLLSEQARERNISIASLLAEIARERELNAAWDSELAASRRDAESQAVATEDQAWEAALADGID